MLLGIALSLGAAVLFNVGAALQALDAREVPAEEDRKRSLLLRLLRRPRWLLGTALVILGFPFQAVALSVASLAVVQSVLALGLVVLLVIGATKLGERVGAAEVGAVAALIVGAALVVLGAPHASSRERGLAFSVGVMAALTLLALLPYVWRRRIGQGFTLSAGLAFGASNVAAKLFTDALKQHGRAVLVAVWLVLSGLSGVLAVQSEMVAFGRRPATRVVPIVFVLQTLAPVLLAPVYQRERWATVPFYGAPLVLGILLVVLGAMAVGRSHAVSLLAGGSDAGTGSAR